jgi:hypothetical protein
MMCIMLILVAVEGQRKSLPNIGVNRPPRLHAQYDCLHVLWGAGDFRNSQVQLEADADGPNTFHGERGEGRLSDGAAAC